MAKHLLQALGHTYLAIVKGAQIDRIVFALLAQRTRALPEGGAGQRVLERIALDLLLYLQGLDTLRGQFDRHLEHFGRGSDQFALRHVDVPLVRLFAQRIGHPCCHAPRRVGRQPHVARDLVGGLEPDPVDLARQAIGVLLHHLHRLVAERLPNLDRPRSADVVPLEEYHDLTDLFLLGPGLLDPRHAGGTDAQHVQKPPRFVFDHVQRVHAVLGHDPRGHDRSHALDQPRSEVLFDPLRRRGQDGAIAVHAKLASKARMARPLALQLERLARIDVRQLAHRRHQVQAAFDRQPHHAISRFRVGIRHALDHAAQLFRHAHLLFAVHYRPTAT